MRMILKVVVVQPGSQAARLGIQTADVLVSFNGSLISTNNDFLTAVYNAKKKGVQSPAIVVKRRGQQITFNATLEPLGLNCVEVANTESVSGASVAYKTDYGVARGISLFIAFVGWVLVAAGIIVALVAISQGADSRYGSLSLMAVIPGLGTAVIGLVLIMGAQLTRATVDNADYTREMLQIMQATARTETDSPELPLPAVHDAALHTPRQCPKCSIVVNADDVFCGSCGQPLQ